MPHQEPQPPNPNEPESLKQLRAMSQSAYRQQTQAPQVTPEMLDNAAVLKIYADFKWQLKVQDRTPAELAKLMEGYVMRFEREIQTPAIRDKAIARFKEEIEKQRDK